MLEPDLFILSFASCLSTTFSPLQSPLQLPLVKQPWSKGSILWPCCYLDLSVLVLELCEFKLWQGDLLGLFLRILPAVIFCLYLGRPDCAKDSVLSVAEECHCLWLLFCTHTEIIFTTCFKPVSHLMLFGSPLRYCILSRSHVEIRLACKWLAASRHMGPGDEWCEQGSQSWCCQTVSCFWMSLHEGELCEGRCSCSVLENCQGLDSSKSPSFSNLTLKSCVQTLLQMWWWTPTCWRLKS